jgi:D-3-phosphoglycerate dehydrogenase / 2-oxoglutarate reductase
MSIRTAYIDCSPLMRSVLDEIGAPAGMMVHAGDPSRSELEALIAGADIVLNGHSHMDEALIASARKLRSIIFLGTGASSYMNIAAAETIGVRVRNIRGYGDRTVAEHAFGLLLCAARNTAAMDRQVRQGIWNASEGAELLGSTLGLIGIGGVGAEMARIANGFGINVVAWNRSGIPDGVPARLVDLDELLATSDAVSLHLALSPETKGLLNTSRLAQLKPGALLVNTARGALVDETALISALRDGRIAHAALDVFETEPLPPGHPLTKLENVTLTSHAAWKSRAASRRLLQTGLDMVAADVARISAGQPLSA